MGGKFKKIRELGQGGNATIFLVENTMRQSYAIKSLNDKKDKVKQMIC
ncbi:MAG: hypothetical protein V8S58_11575 [Lachnospiraceae bacterium]